ncbi:uncharacterized protein [Medicago truncatula]|uniref:uncharacterized protein isoform X3 n=1 Tax=Medicago truncatula TaxID=3880 RepID=UPI001967A67F|nr:uncharacterized protein LOC11438433 isoform X3 [Medicago truncatula]
MMNDAEASAGYVGNTASSRHQPRHKRSNSASDRNSKFSRGGGVLRSIGKDQDEFLASPLSARASRIQTPLHDNHNCINKNASSNHRASLEQDVEQLQLHLQKEKSMRILLERAMGRASSTLSPGHRHFASQVHEKFSSIEKAPVLRALKDHLHQCPSRLSEEMMKCMATMYCWLRSAKSVNAENSRSPILSRSSTNAIQPRHSIVEDQDCSCKSAVEISWIATRKRHSSHASYAMDNYRILVEQLERVNISQMECDRKIVFWINVHNALVMHAHLAYGIPQSSLRRLALFHKAAYNIGGHIISANTIEQAIFCFRTPRLGRWLESVVSAALRKKSGEERQLINSKFGIIDSQPLVCFALCTGALSDPMLKVYTASNLREELDAAKREFLQANVVVKKSSKVILPKLVERFSREASINIDNILGWMMENVDKKLHDSIQKCIDRKSNKKPSQIIEWRPYSSKFRYMFSKDLIDKL